MPVISSKIRALFATLLIFSVLLVQIESRSRTFRALFKASWFKGAPDGVEREILGFNGKFPPAIRINKGDSVRMEIQNLIKPNQLLDIHHHGIFQKGTLTADGVGGTTQCDPLFGQKYVYKFNPGEQTGTYWYHSHAGLQFTDGLRAPFIIDDPEDPFLRSFNYYIDKKYLKLFNDKHGRVTSKLFYVDHSKIDNCNDPDSVIFLYDWHHEKADILGARFLSPASGGNEPTPDSALINNVGNYRCTSPPNCLSMYETKIVAGKAKKFRIINGSSMAVFHFAIEGHKMHIVETDGITLDGTTVVDTIRLNAGQRYSVIVKADQEPRNYWIRAKMDENIYPEGTVSPNWQPEVFGELKYSSQCGDLFTNVRPSEASFISMNAQLEKSIQDGMKNIDMDVPLVPMRDLYPCPPKTPTKKIILNVAPVTANDGTQYLAFNNIVYHMPMDTTVLGQILNHEAYDHTFQKDGVTWGVNAHDIQKGDVVDLIINNFDGMEHPMHGHGHAFYVMYQGVMDSNDFITDPTASYTFAYNHNAALRDTASVNGNSVLVLRFIADNPGAWVFHCHIDWHLFAGLMATIVEDKHRIRKLYNRYVNDVTMCEMPGVQVGDTWKFEDDSGLNSSHAERESHPIRQDNGVEKQTLIQKSHKLRHNGHSDQTVMEPPKETKIGDQDSEVRSKIVEGENTVRKEKNEIISEGEIKITRNVEERRNEEHNENKAIENNHPQRVEENRNTQEERAKLVETREIPSQRLEVNNQGQQIESRRSDTEERSQTAKIKLDERRTENNQSQEEEHRRVVSEEKSIEVKRDKRRNEQQEEPRKIVSEEKSIEIKKDERRNEQQEEPRKIVSEEKPIEIKKREKK
jgi:iron transport multicopper oxidase